MSLSVEKTSDKDRVCIHTNKVLFTDKLRDASGIRKYLQNTDIVLSLDTSHRDYYPFDKLPSDEFFIKLAQLEGITEIQLHSPYEIKVEKAKLVVWTDILPKIEEALFGLLEPKIEEVSEENPATQV